MDLIHNADKVYKENFPNTVCFERAIFFSWGCTIGDCAFCYMSTQPESKKPTETKRSRESILAEFILAKHLKWDIGFFSGGIGAFNKEEMLTLLKSINEITGQKIWLNIGPVSKAVLEQYAPYLKGIVGSIETINPELHKVVCPSKPIAPYEKMFEVAKDLGLERGMTIILGMGEKKEDLKLLVDFIKKYGIVKIHLYSLIPHKGTFFENSKLISAEEQAWWIANLRIEFPKLDIQCGIWEDRLERIPLLLKAGANSISKFKATKYFGKKLAYELEEQARNSGRELIGSLTKLPDINWNAEVDKLSLDEDMKQKVKLKLKSYIDEMSKKTL